MTQEHMLLKMRQGWKGDHICGKGSTSSATRRLRERLPGLLDQYNITTIADVGAGNLSWIKGVDIGDVVYSPFDIVPRHPDVTEFNATLDVLPKAYDVIMCRYVLNHISADLARAMLKNFRMTGSKYLLMSMFDAHESYWRKHGMYPMQEELIEEFQDDTVKNKRMQLYRLNDT